MTGSRSLLHRTLVGLLLAVVALTWGAAGSAGAAPYPPAPTSYDPGSIVVQGDFIRACGPAAATDTASAFGVAVNGAAVASGATGADGSYCVTTPVPAGLAGGTHTATFNGMKNGTPFTLSATFERGAAGGALPRTGSDTADLVGLATILLVAGAALVTVTGVRRRNAQA